MNKGIFEEFINGKIIKLGNIEYFIKDIAGITVEVRKKLMSSNHFNGLDMLVSSYSKYEYEQFVIFSTRICIKRSDIE